MDLRRRDAQFLEKDTVHRRVVVLPGMHHPHLDRAVQPQGPLHRRQLHEVRPRSRDKINGIPTGHPQIVSHSSAAPVQDATISSVISIGTAGSTDESP